MHHAVYHDWVLETVLNFLSRPREDAAVNQLNNAGNSVFDLAMQYPRSLDLLRSYCKAPVTVLGYTFFRFTKGVGKVITDIPSAVASCSLQ